MNSSYDEQEPAEGQGNSQGMPALGQPALGQPAPPHTGFGEGAIPAGSPAQPGERLHGHGPFIGHGPLQHSHHAPPPYLPHHSYPTSPQPHGSAPHGAPYFGGTHNSGPQPYGPPSGEMNISTTPIRGGTSQHPFHAPPPFGLPQTPTIYGSSITDVLGTRTPPISHRPPSALYPHGIQPMRPPSNVQPPSGLGTHTPPGHQSTPPTPAVHAGTAPHSRDSSRPIETPMQGPQLPRTSAQQAALFDIANPDAYQALLMQVLTEQRDTVDRLRAVSNIVEQQGVQIADLEKKMDELSAQTEGLSLDGSGKPKRSKISPNQHPELKDRCHKLAWKLLGMEDARTPKEQNEALVKYQPLFGTDEYYIEHEDGTRQYYPHFDKGPDAPANAAFTAAVATQTYDNQQKTNNRRRMANMVELVYGLEDAASVLDTDWASSRVTDTTDENLSEDSKARRTAAGCGYRAKAVYARMWRRKSYVRFLRFLDFLLYLERRCTLWAHTGVQEFLTKPMELEEGNIDPQTGERPSKRVRVDPKEQLKKLIKEPKKVQVGTQTYQAAWTKANNEAPGLGRSKKGPYEFMVRKGWLTEFEAGGKRLQMRPAETLLWWSTFEVADDMLVPADRNALDQIPESDPEDPGAVGGAGA
ncbi:hypothetical protein LXA43DRAFT_1134437 [Ganoderma leucocontextum]|nr:hypothetical protein LXA43DRAFT_1134437 [Ganoderma leucocontextum]